MTGGGRFTHWAGDPRWLASGLADDSVVSVFVAAVVAMVIAYPVASSSACPNACPGGAAGAPADPTADRVTGAAAPQGKLQCGLAFCLIIAFPLCVARKVGGNSMDYGRPGG